MVIGGVWGDSFFSDARRTAEIAVVLCGSSKQGADERSGITGGALKGKVGRLMCDRTTYSIFGRGGTCVLVSEAGEDGRVEVLHAYDALGSVLRDGRHVSLSRWISLKPRLNERARYT